ncbi:LysR family transcriptional regulator [Streptomyces yerevanensis]|uniref:LysR family transcriptional regulator n=1 Tax=Streptomyces yerevanensis TaxID=66378 RepID=UPI0005277125
MSDIEARELRYFVAVAEELNFSRAADRLGIAQPPLSKAVRRLEEKLGVRLLERTTRRVALTPAGTVLLRHGQSALEAISAAAQRAVRAGMEQIELVVAVKAGSGVDLLKRILGVYREGTGVPPAKVVVSGWGGPAALLRNGKADTALIRTPFDGRGLELEPLSTEPRYAVLAADHPLASRTRLRRADLADDPKPCWAGADPVTNAYWHGLDPESLATEWPDLSDPATAPEGPQVQDITQLLEVVALGQAVAFLPASLTERYSRSDVVYRPVSDLSPSTVAVAWPAGSRDRAVAAFVRSALAVVSAEPERRLSRVL